MIGPAGLGRAEEAGVLAEVDLVVGTFSKSLGAIGGYCVSPKHDLDPIRAKSRAYTFTASPAPATAASVIAGLRVLAEQPELRARLANHCERLWRGLAEAGIEVPDEPGPILPVRLKDERTAVDAWHTLLREGVYVNLVVPPASPGNFALLRCSLSAAHTDHDLEQIIAGFGHIAKRFRKE